MILFSREAVNGDPAAVVFGAHLHGGRLRCGVLMVIDHNPHETVTLTDPGGQHETRVSLPAEAIGATGLVRINQVALEST